MTVPFADLYAQYLTIKDEIDAAIAGVIRESAFVRGRYVETFERGVRRCAWHAVLRFLRQRYRRASHRDARVGREAW